MRSILYLSALIIFLSSCSQKQDPKVLVFSKTEGFRHTSIEPGTEAIKKLGMENGFGVDHSEDASIITEENLKQYDAVIFLSTTGDIFNDEQQYEFERYVQAGGGFVGIHAAADTEYKWPWYGDLVGAYFLSHPPGVHEAEVNVLNKEHASCSHLEDVWTRTDEWYNYKDINPSINVLMNLDESTYEGGANGENHPIAWTNEIEGSKMFYTGMGHTDESFSDEVFMKHILGGIQYVIEDGKKSNYASENVGPALNRFQKIVLDQNLNEPMELALLPDGDILFIERKGNMKLYSMEDKKTRVVHSFDVHTVHEDGLLGLALDPNYKENNWIYLFYSPIGDKPVQNVSRFNYKDGKVDLESEKVVIEIPVQRDECCHSAGSMEFDAHGNLLIAVGDNTNPHQSDGYSPSDGGAGREPFDARRSSSNTNDLRGKILRITPQSDGTYTIPEGNLFEASEKTRPEIFVMGCRNPFRFFVDPKTDYLYWGDVGPDAGEDGEERGPKGHDEVNQARKAGYFGWPLFVADNKAYYDYNFASKKSGSEHDASAPLNSSPNNSGLNELPPANKAFIYYPYEESEEFPLVGKGGRNAMAAFVYYYDDFPESPKKLPKYYDGKLFTYDWMRGWFMAVTMDEEGNYVSMERFLPNHKFSNPTDIIMTPEGEIFMLEYGTAWFSQNEDARLVHLEFSGDNRIPVPNIKVGKTMGAAPLIANFDGSESIDYDGDDIKYKWFIDDKEVGNKATMAHNFADAGNYIVRLETSDKSGKMASSEIKMIVGNEKPKVTITVDGNQSFYFDNAPLKYKVNVSDKEDGTVGNGIAESKVAVNMDYLESGYDKNVIAMGHMSALTSHPGMLLMKDSDCYTCHKEEEKSVGPTYIEVSKKYQNDSKAVSYLAERIIKGGGGVWGELAMAAHPQLSNEEVESMVDYILSIAEQKDKDSSIPLSGEHKMVHSTDKKPGGVFILNASYIDEGTDKAGPIATTETKVFRSSMISAADFDGIQDAMKFDIEPGQFPGVDEKMSIIIGNHDSYIWFSDIDLTGISNIIAIAMANPMFMAGGTIQLILDDIDGEVVAEGEIPLKESMDPSMAPLTLNNVKGVHDLYFKFVSKDESKAAMALTFLKFNM